MDYQRACQAYVWSTPLVSITAFRDGQTSSYGVTGETDFVVFDSLKEKRGIVTANLTTPYILNFISLAGGPLEIAYPAGQTAGGVIDFWQRPVCDLGLTGPDQGKGGTYIIVGPEHDPAAHRREGVHVFQSETNNILVGLRIIDRTPGFFDTVKQQLTMGCVGQPARPCPLHRRQGRRVGRDRAAWPRLLAHAGRRPPAGAGAPGRQGLDRHAAAAGHRQGPGVDPDQRQQRILLAGAAMGELMARNLQVNPRFAEPYWKNTRWCKCFDFTIPQETETRVELDERTTWFYEAVTSSEGMVNPVVGAGQVYMTTKRDTTGALLRADKTYRLRVPEGRPRRPILVVDPLQRGHPPTVRQRRHRHPQHEPRQQDA